MTKKKRRARALIKRSTAKAGKRPLMLNRKHAGGKEHHTEEALRTQLTKQALSAHPVAAQTFALAREAVSEKPLFMETRMLTREEALATYGEPEKKRPVIRRSAR